MSCNVTPNQPGAQMLHQINIKHVTPNKCYTKTRPGAQTPKYLALKMPLFHPQFGRLSGNFGTFFTVWPQCLLLLCVKNGNVAQSQYFEQEIYLFKGQMKFQSQTESSIVRYVQQRFILSRTNLTLIGHPTV